MIAALSTRARIQNVQWPGSGRRAQNRGLMGDTMSSIGFPRDRARWAFFLAVAISFLVVLYVDERFLIDGSDPEWKHIAPFRWLLLVHGLAGATAFLTGPFQFSDTIRRTHLKLHRWLGRIYVGAIFVAAPMAGYIGGRFEEPLTAAMQPAQAGLWFFCTAMALVCVLRGNVPAHRQWMMKSYAFCLIFVTSRLPDIFHVQWTDTRLSTTLWYLVVAALVGPDIVLTVRELWRKRARA